MKRNILITTLTTIIVLLLAIVAFSVWEENYSDGHLTYTSAVKVHGLNGDVSSILPIIDDAKIPGGTAADYLSTSSCLGHYGPLSAYGPLGTLGPIGDNTWNVSYWISAFGDWSDWSDDSYGALGPDGPLGHNGPVANSQYYGIEDPGLTLFQTNDFAVHSRALGIWSVLGPVGPLGALGPLGPLGPIGAHGYATNSDGQYIHSGQVMRTITVDYDGNGQTRTYELFEVYDEDFAKTMTDNDTSFMVVGSNYKSTDSFKFTSHYNQIITILIVPEKELDDFDLYVGLDDGDTPPVITSNTGYETMDWVQMKVQAGTKMHIAVRNYWSGHFLSSTYRLIVVGSGPDINKTEITGNHIGVWK